MLMPVLCWPTCLNMHFLKLFDIIPRYQYYTSILRVRMVRVFKLHEIIFRILWRFIAENSRYWPEFRIWNRNSSRLNAAETPTLWIFISNYTVQCLNVTSWLKRYFCTILRSLILVFKNCVEWHLPTISWWRQPASLSLPTAPCQHLSHRIKKTTCHGWGTGWW